MTTAPCRSRRNFIFTTLTAVTAGFLSSRCMMGAADDSASHAVVQQYVEQYGFQGVAGLGRAGRSLFAEAAGMADIEGQRPMTVTTPFGIASVSKMLTAVSVLKLIEQGKLALDEPIIRYLPWYRQDQGSLLTLRRLMANVSGVPNEYSPALKADHAVSHSLLTTKEAVHRYAEGDLLFAPGARFDYSLSNWILVLAIVESVTKTDFLSAMRELTLVPLHLSETTLADQPSTAVPYSGSTPPLRLDATRPNFVAAAGGYNSTLHDLMSAAHSIFDTRFLSSASREALLHREFPADEYALGGSVRAVKIGGAVVQAAWDTGNTSGYRTVVGHRLDGRGTVVVLNNTSMSQKVMDDMSVALLRSLGDN